jgi:hypothetical protein
MHRVKRRAGAAKPVRNLAHVLPVTVIEVPARSEDFDDLGAAGDHAIEQAGMQPLRPRIHQR